MFPSSVKDPLVGGTPTLRLAIIPSNSASSSSTSVSSDSISVARKSVPCGIASTLTSRPFTSSSTTRSSNSVLVSKNIMFPSSVKDPLVGGTPTLRLAIIPSNSASSSSTSVSSDSISSNEKAPTRTTVPSVTSIEPGVIISPVSSIRKGKIAPSLLFSFNFPSPSSSIVNALSATGTPFRLTVNTAPGV